MSAKTISQSDKVYQKVIQQRVMQPLILTPDALSARPEAMMADPNDSRFRIDERYQRAKVTPWVNTLIIVLKSGGTIPDPIDVVERADGCLYIVDGQQRWWAHSETNTPIQMRVWRLRSYEDEVKLFRLLNDRKNLNAETILRGWNGPITHLLKAVDADQSTQMCGQIDWGTRLHRCYSAVGLTRGVIAVTAGVTMVGDTKKLLARADAELERSAQAAQRAKDYLLLLPLIFQTGVAGSPRVSPSILVGFGRSCHARWARTGSTHNVFPGVKEMKSLRTVNWSQVMPSGASRFIVLVEQEIDAKWPKAKEAAA